MSFYFSNKKRLLDTDSSPDAKKAKVEHGIREVLAPTTCRIPNFKRDKQEVLTTATMKPLQYGCQIGVMFNVLSQEQRAAYVSGALRNKNRIQLVSSFGHLTPRRSINYGSLTDSFGRNNRMIPYPPYVLEVEKILCSVNRGLSFLTRLTAVDTCYDSSFERGGSSSAQSETTHPLITDLVIYSVGQTRILRVRDIESPENWFNIPLVDNSMVTLVGYNFQRKYTHQIDKLAVGEPVGTHISLKIFYVNKDLRE